MKDCKPCGPAGSAPPRLAPPMWADPMLSMLTSSWRRTTVVMLMGVVAQLCKPDPRRIAFGFGLGTQAATFAIAPQPDPQISGFAYGFNGGPQFFNIFTYGPIVNEAWYGIPSQNCSIAIYEVYRLQ